MPTGLITPAFIEVPFSEDLQALAGHDLIAPLGSPTLEYHQKAGARVGEQQGKGRARNSPGCCHTHGHANACPLWWIMGAFSQRAAHRRPACDKTYCVPCPEGPETQLSPFRSCSGAHIQGSKLWATVHRTARSMDGGGAGTSGVGNLSRCLTEQVTFEVDFEG